MTGVKDLLPDNADKIHPEDVICPLCGHEDINYMNKGMAYCKSDDCAIYNFDPQ